MLIHFSNIQKKWLLKVKYLRGARAYPTVSNLLTIVLTVRNRTH
jgi:hypothetical protein